eukprot:scaffold962_cov372-Prasinococcus_capsulatus_cf.AAC.5
MMRKDGGDGDGGGGGGGGVGGARLAGRVGERARRGGWGERWAARRARSPSSREELSGAVVRARLGEMSRRNPLRRAAVPCRRALPQVQRTDALSSPLPQTRWLTHALRPALGEWAAAVVSPPRTEHGCAPWSGDDKGPVSPARAPVSRPTRRRGLGAHGPAHRRGPW